MIMKREDIIPRGNIQKVRRNLFGSPTQEDRDSFTKMYEEQMAKDRQVIILFLDFVAAVFRCRRFWNDTNPGRLTASFQILRSY